MSELFVVRVAEVSAKSVKLAVRSVHPDSGPVRPTSTFALQLIYDPILNSRYSAFKAYDHLEAAPLAQVMDMASYLNPQWVKTNANAFLAKAKVTNGVLEVWPTHPGWTAHLRRGMTWDTAAYDMGPGLPAKPRAPAAEVPMTRSPDPNAGFRTGKPLNKQIKLRQVLLATESANKYLADPVATTPAEMKRTLKSLVGQPIAVVPNRGPVEVGTVVELRTDSVYVYNETGDGGWGTNTLVFNNLKSLGRAWLKVPVADAKPAAHAAATTDARATAKKATKKVTKAAAKQVATAAAKTVARATAKKTTRTGAKNVATKGAKATAKKATTATAKKSVKATAKKATTAAARTGAKATAKKATTAAARTGAKATAKKASKTVAKKVANTATKKVARAAARTVGKAAATTAAAKR